MDLKQGDNESILKPFALVTAKPKQERRQETTTPAPAFNSMRDNTTHVITCDDCFHTTQAKFIKGEKRFFSGNIVDTACKYV